MLENEDALNIFFNKASVSRFIVEFVFVISEVCAKPKFNETEEDIMITNTRESIVNIRTL